MENNTNTTPAPEKKSHGALVGSIIIIVILVIGGIYIWQSKMKTVLEQKKAAEGQVTPADTSDLNSLENDLNTADPSLDINIDDIE